MKPFDARLRPTVYVDSVPELAALRSRQGNEGTHSEHSRAAHRDEAVTPRDGSRGRQREAARWAAWC